MTYPKLPDGPHPVGEAKVRFMKTLDAPYLSASAPGWSAHKTGGFSRVEVTHDPKPELEPVVMGGGWYSFSEGLRVPDYNISTFVHIRKARRLKGVFQEGGVLLEQGLNDMEWLRKTVGIYPGAKGELWFFQVARYDGTYRTIMLRSARGEDPTAVTAFTNAIFAAGVRWSSGNTYIASHEGLLTPYPIVTAFMHGRTSLLMMHHNWITPLRGGGGKTYSACAPVLRAMRYSEGALEGYAIAGLPTEGGKSHVMVEMPLLGEGRVGAVVFSYTAEEAFSHGELVVRPRLYEISENEVGILEVRREVSMDAIYADHVPRPDDVNLWWIDMACAYLAYNTKVLPLTETKVLVLNKVITDWGDNTSLPAKYKLQHTVFNTKTGSVESVEDVTEFFPKQRAGTVDNSRPFSGDGTLLCYARRVSGAGVVVVGHGTWLRYNSFNKAAELVTGFGANKRVVTNEIGMVSPVVVGTRNADGSGYVVYFIRSYTVDYWSELFDEVWNAGTGYEDSDPRSMLREVWVAKDDMTVFEKVCDIVEDSKDSKRDYTELLHAGTRLVPGHTLGSMPWIHDAQLDAPAWFKDDET